jgi:UDP-glucuronate decarboxylase
MISKKLNYSKREFSEWSEFEGESIFLTGGSGFFGSAFLYSLLESNKKRNLNINVTVLTRSVNSFKAKNPKIANCSFINFIEGNVINFDFPNEKFSKIFHLATTSAFETFNGESQLKKYKTLVDGTERVLQFAVFCNADKVIFTSSGVVYGELPQGMKSVKESYSGAPDTSLPSSALAQGKRSAEFLISYYADLYGFDYVIARCFSFVGPFLPLELHYAIGNFVFDALYNETIKIKGDGTPLRSYLDVNDLIIWLLRLTSTACKHKIYNVGSDQSLTILDLAKKIRNIISPEKEINILGDLTHSIGNFSRDYYVPNIDRAKNELALEVWIDIDKAIIRLKDGALLNE